MAKPKRKSLLEQLGLPSATKTPTSVLERAAASAKRAIEQHVLQGAAGIGESTVADTQRGRGYVPAVLALPGGLAGVVKTGINYATGAKPTASGLPFSGSNL